MDISTALASGTSTPATSNPATPAPVPTAAAQAWINNMGLSSNALQQKPAATPAPEPTPSPAAQAWMANIQKTTPSQANSADSETGPATSAITNKIDEQFKFEPGEREKLFDNINDAAGADNKLSMEEYRQLKFTMLNQPHLLNIDQNDKSEFAHMLDYGYNQTTGGWGGIFALAVLNNPDSEA